MSMVFVESSSVAVPGGPEAKPRRTEYEADRIAANLRCEEKRIGLEGGASKKRECWREEKKESREDECARALQLSN